MTPIDVIKLAETIRATPRPKDVHIRTAINRAYYAAFYHATDWAAKFVPGALTTDKKIGMHKEFALRLANPDASLADADKEKSVDLSDDLLALHSERVRADYKLGEPVTIDDAIQAICDARSILATY